MVGEMTPISRKDLVNYPDFVEGMRKAEELNQDLVFDRKSLVVYIQIVQGALYHVNVDVLQSCSASTNCKVKKHCSFQIWSRLWLVGDENLQLNDMFVLYVKLM